MPKILSDRIVWDADDWFAGSVPQAEVNNPKSFGNGASYMHNVNPFRQPGSICPGFSPDYLVAGNVSTVSSYIRAVDTDITSASTAYFLSEYKVYKFNALTYSFYASDPWPHIIDSPGSDLKIYSITNAETSVTSTMVLYSYGTNVGAYDISSGTLNVFYDTFLSTQPTGASTLTSNTHPMILGDNGDIYIGNGNKLLELDGRTGGNGNLRTALTLPEGTVINSFTKTSDYLILICYRSSASSTLRGNATAYFWNYLSDNYNFAYDLGDNYATAGFNWLGRPGCFTYGRSNLPSGNHITNIKVFDGSKFKLLTSYVGEPPSHNGVDILDAMLVFSGSYSTTGFVGAYGIPWSSNNNGILNFIAAPSGYDKGICKNLTQGRLYVSSGATTSGGLDIFFSRYSYASYWQGTIAKPSFSYNNKGKIKSVKVHFKKASTAGRTLLLRLQFDGTSTYSDIFDTGTITETNGGLVREYFVDSSGIKFPLFHSVWPYFYWNIGTDNTDAPAVEKLEVFYESVKNIQV